MKPNQQKRTKEEITPKREKDWQIRMKAMNRAISKKAAENNSPKKDT